MDGWMDVDICPYRCGEEDEQVEDKDVSSFLFHRRITVSLWNPNRSNCKGR
jgi:hypothetical protein